jgi:tetratricopeptide (TPR) repeat protein
MKVQTQWLRVACAAMLVLAPAQVLLAAPGGRQAFDQAVKDLQKNPSDTALRKKIFKMARGLASLPEVPDDVAILKGKAAYIVKNANSPADFGPAVDAYEKATNLAPWVPELYYNLGVVQEKAGAPELASESFKLYLAADPDASDRDKVLARLGGLEVQQEKKQQGGAQAVQQQQAAEVNPRAQRDWESRRGAAIAVAVLGGITMGIGAVALGVGAGDTGSALYTTSPGYSKGVLYNKYYEGKYWSSASYDTYTQGEAEMGLGWTFLALGGLGLIVGIAMDPGPQPRAALMNIQGGKLAMAMPTVDMNPGLGGWQTTLVHAEF